MWLLDMIAPSQKLATSVLANFRQVAKADQIRMHPLVTRMVDPEILKKMGVQLTSAAKNSEALNSEKN